MKAMVLNQIEDLSKNHKPLVLKEVSKPIPGSGEVLVKIHCCAVCHTELDEIEGRTAPPAFPVILGHQVVGLVEDLGPGVKRLKHGDRVGVAWIFSSCGKCHYCLSGNENLCEFFVATGRDVNGGYAEYMTVPEKSAHLIPEIFSDAQAAPLLCAGAIGYRSVKLTGMQNGDTLGLTGFGASAHLVLKMVRFKYPDSKVYVFARNKSEREFALEQGAVWSGDSSDAPPEKLRAIIDTTPVWKPVIEALKNLEPGGRLVINAIRKQENDKEELLKLDYEKHLWMEKEIKSVANVALSDVREFLDLAAEVPILPDVKEYALEDANLALMEIKQQKIRGAKVLRIAG